MKKKNNVHRCIVSYGNHVSCKKEETPETTTNKLLSYYRTPQAENPDGTSISVGLMALMY
jgi:hypothetical protein